MTIQEFGHRPVQEQDQKLSVRHRRFVPRWPAGIAAGGGLRRPPNKKNVSESRAGSGGSECTRVAVPFQMKESYNEDLRNLRQMIDAIGGTASIYWDPSGATMTTASSFRLPP